MPAKSGVPVPRPAHPLLEPRIFAAQDDAAITRVRQVARGLHQQCERLTAELGPAKAALVRPIAVPGLLLWLRSIDQMSARLLVCCHSRMSGAVRRGRAGRSALLWCRSW